MIDQFEPIIAGYASRLDGASIFKNALNLIAEQRSALIEDQWDDFEDLANQGLGMAYGRYREIHRNLSHSLNAQAAAHETFIDILQEKTKDVDSRESFFAEMKAELIKLNPDISPEVLEGLTKMGQGESGTAVFDLIKSVKDTFSGNNAEMIQSAIEGVVALAVRSLMALTYANYQAHNELLIETNAIGPHGEEFYDLLEPPVIALKEQLDNKIKHVYQELVAGVSPVHACEHLIQFVEESLPTLSRTQATIRQYANALNKAGKGSLSEKVGKLSAIAGDLTRSAFTAQAAAYYLSLQSLLDKPDADAKQLLTKSDRMGYDTDFPNGKNTEIAKIDQVSDGEYIEVSGFAQSISVSRDSDRKLISRIVLHDPSSNSSVMAVGIFVHFRHIGLLEGSYCILSGTWQSASRINNNEPAIEIDKLGINDLKKHSWVISFLDVADKFVDRWPGGYNICYSLAPHVSAFEQGEEESKILGAGELIFKPFIRR